jgi:hypothetical protein
MNVTKIMTRPLKSSFLSCEKDTEDILRKLFVTSHPYSNQLKRLLMINTNDCLDDCNQNYDTIVNNTSLKELFEGKYISLIPRIKRKEHEEEKSYIILTFDEFTSTGNPEYRDCKVVFDVYCNPDCWMLKDYQQRPLKIIGIIDGLMNKAKFSGIGELQFENCIEINFGETLMGYSLTYVATHGNDDSVERE